VKVGQVCLKVGMSRQNYYGMRKQRQGWAVDEELVAKLVRQERQVQPRIGGRKLGRVLAPALAEAGIKMGRDRLFKLLREQDLLVPALPRTWPQTTHYNASLPVFHNEIKDLTIERANQVWVSDLTYVRTGQNYLYLSLITDRYSRKIVGWYAHDTLETTGSLKALEMALAGLPAGAKPIHHSDRGCQYCSHEYVQALTQGGLSVSMTETDHCAENALAERVNGILKQEYGIGGGFLTHAQARQAIAQAVHLYNTRRLHSAIGYQVPAQVYLRGCVAQV
jgi:transposase InsO family protein